MIATLERQLAETITACALAHAVAEGSCPAGEAHGRMAEIEHRGDLLRGKFVAKLTGVLVAPIDREDLFRLSRSIDDVLDNLRDFVREWDLFEIKPTDVYLGLLDATGKGLEDLQRAVQTIGQDPRS